MHTLVTYTVLQLKYAPQHHFQPPTTFFPYGDKRQKFCSNTKTVKIMVLEGIQEENILD
jgi:hypothetical protein